MFTGGGAKLDGIVELAKQKLRLPASIGALVDISGITDRVNDPAFSTAIGLAQWGVNETPSVARRRGGAGILAKVNAVGGVAGRIKKWFDTIVP